MSHQVGVVGLVVGEQGYFSFQVGLGAGDEGQFVVVGAVFVAAVVGDVDPVEGPQWEGAISLCGGGGRR